MIEMDWLKKWSRYSPTSVAFKDADTGAEYSYGSLYYLSCRLAQHLKATFAIQSGDRVASLAGNELEYLPLFFALQRLGAILVPVNFRLTAREISHILGDCDAKLLISQTAFATIVEDVEKRALPPAHWSFDKVGGSTPSLREFIGAELKKFNDENLLSALRTSGQKSWIVDFSGSLESTSMILYTSGTTGAPKGAMISNQMLHWNSINTSLRLNLQQADVSLSFLPLFHTGGWNVLLTPFVHRGARTVLMRKFEPTRVLSLCESEGVTILFGVPTTMNMMAHEPSFDSVNLSTLRYAIVGGEPMPVELIRTWKKKGVPIRQGYGLTEFGPNVFSLNEEDAIRKIGSIGFANFYIQTRIVDASNREVGTGEIGELLLSGPMCTPGYWRNQKATEATIQDGWLHTGDLVRCDEEGYFYVVGRKKEMFISGGENVYPVEVEQFLGTHPAVREVAVIGVPDPKWGEVGRAFVSLKKGSATNEEELLKYCLSGLAKFKTPKQVTFVPELPKGDSGKILKRKLAEFVSN